MQVGEILLSVDGKPVKRTIDLVAAVEQKRPKEKLALQLKGASGPRSLELVLGETPHEIPLFEPTLLYNKVMMDLRQQVEGYPGTEPAAFAWLNLGLAAMHFQDYAAAHSFLTRARTELPRAPGSRRAPPSTTSGWPWRGSTTRARPGGLSRGRGAQGRHPHRQRRSGGGAPGRAARGAVMTPPARLVWEKADGTRVEFPLTAAIHLVGREEPADIQVSEPLVSRSHARLERRGEAWVLLDLGSTNFTRVNGNRIGEAELQDGDLVRFGRARCVFHSPEGSVPGSELSGET